MANRSIYIAAVVIAFLASVSLADQTQDAYQKLHEREAARAAAATQPANVTNAELDAMQKRIKDLERQVTTLLIENAKLRSEAVNKADREAIIASRAADAAKREHDGRPWSEKVKRGMTIEEVTAAITFQPRHISTNADGQKVVTWMIGPEDAPLMSMVVTFGAGGKVVDFVEQR